MKQNFAVMPRLKPMPPKRAIDFSVLDIGTSKVACLIGRLRPLDEGPLLPGRTHRIEVLGIGHHRSRGLKAGTIADMEAAEQSIRHAVDAAERMADLRVESVIMSVSGGRLMSEHYNATVPVSGRPIGDYDIQRVLSTVSDHSVRPDRSVLHSMPLDFALDQTPGIRDPRSMVGSELGLDLHVCTADAAPVRNLVLCIERCHLSVKTVVASPYAAALAALADDEAEIGVTVVDMGAGTTTIGVVCGGRFVHTDAIALGGHHVTLDLARGLSIRVDEAERIKTLHASVFTGRTDDHEMIGITPVGDDVMSAPHHVPKSHIVNIVKPRVEETLELIRDRLHAMGYAHETGKRVVLTGGACQLNGLPDLASRIFGRQVRVGRPLGIRGLPDQARGPAFAVAAGLLVYPQRASEEHFEAARTSFRATGTHGYFSRMGQWLKESF